MELELTKYLRAHPDWATSLREEPYCLRVKEKDNYVLFKYDQFNSDMTQVICREARGIIYDKTTLTPVCIPFFKFFNYGEGLAAQIDWPTAKITEKIDGYLTKLWYDKGAWHLSSNGMIDAFDAEFDDNGISVGDLFEMAINMSFTDFAAHANLDPHFTYMFEVINRFYPVTIKYPKNQIYLIGIRDNRSIEERPLSTLNPYRFEVPQIYSADSLDDLLEYARSWRNPDMEGFVVQDQYYNRIKVKLMVYLENFYAATTKQKFTPKFFTHLFKCGALDDMLAVVPAWKAQADYCLRLLNEYYDWQKTLCIDYNVKGFEAKDVSAFLRAHGELNTSFVWGYRKDQIPYYGDWLDKMSESQMRNLLAQLIVADRGSLRYEPDDCE